MRSKGGIFIIHSFDKISRLIKYIVSSVISIRCGYNESFCKSKKIIKYVMQGSNSNNLDCILETSKVLG